MESLIKAELERGNSQDPGNGIFGVVKPEEQKISEIDSTEEDQKESQKYAYFLPDITKRNRNLSRQDFFKEKKHFFIMAEGGKPIYSRYGDVLEHCGIFATYSAICTKLTHFNNSKDFSEKIHFISTDSTTSVFLKKGNIILIALSKEKEPISLLISQLESLYNQLLSILTIERMKRLEANSNSTINALSDTDDIFEQTILYSTNTLTAYLSSYQILLMESIARTKLSNICSANKGDALLTIVLTHHEIISITLSDAIVSVSASDVLLIQNLIFTSESLKLTESWLPICLTGISDAGYLQMYCNFFEPNFGIIFITESQENSYFMKFCDQSREIYEQSQRENIIDAIKNAVEYKKLEIQKNYIMKSLSDEKIFDDFFNRLSNENLRIKNLHQDPFENVKYMICKSKNLNQIFSFRFDYFENTSEQEKGIIKSYCSLYDLYKNQINNINPNNFFHMEKTDNNTNIIFLSDNNIIFATLNLFMEYEEIHNIIVDCNKVIKAKENYFFSAHKQ